MPNQIENLDSPNETVDQETVNDLETSNEAELKEKNRQLFERAKKAELELKELRGKSKDEKPAEAKPSESKGFDYGELYLEVKGVTHPEDQSWLLDMAKQQNISVKDVYGKDWVQKDLKERSAMRSADNAVPTGSKRSQGATPTEDTVEYWVAQDKQPPESYPLAFRAKVLKAREKTVEQGGKFAHNSIIAPGFPLG